MARRCKNKCGNELPTVKNCETIFQRKGYCDIDCLAEHTRKKNKEADRKKAAKSMREAKERVKTRQEWIRDAQRWFNKFIRLRDDKEPCISCGRYHTGQYHAGHYRTTAAAPQLRFDERQVWKQCSPCNNHLSGNIPKYRPSLVAKLGLATVEEIENNSDIKRWTIEELKEIKRIYKNKLKEMTT